MARLSSKNNMFEQYGIKEVADVQLEDITTGKIVLYLDTLKVSTIETTADQSEAKGGKGNAPLIVWDFGKEINVTLQDALFTQASMALMNSATTVIDKATVRVVQELTLATADNELNHQPKAGTTIKYINLTKGTNGIFPATDVTSSKFAISVGSPAVAIGEAKDLVKFFYDVETEDTQSYTFTVSANSFPGTYKVIGDTFIRNRDGLDISYQFVIPRAKIASDSTISMEAEGDPSVFDMNLRVLRADDGSMIKFIKYSLEAEEVAP